MSPIPCPPQTAIPLTAEGAAVPALYDGSEATAAGINGVAVTGDNLSHSVRLLSAPERRWHTLGQAIARSARRETSDR